MSGREREEIPEAIALPIERTGSESSLLSEEFELTALARGPWQPDAAHGGAPAALLTRMAEGFGGEEMRLASLSCTFNGPVTLGEVAIEAEVSQPGRRQNVVSAKMNSANRTLIDARAVLIRRRRPDAPRGRRPGAVHAFAGGRARGGQRNLGGGREPHLLRDYEHDQDPRGRHRQDR